MALLRNMRISVRMALCFGILLVMLTGMGVLGITRMGDVEERLEEITGVNNVELALTVQMRIAVNQVNAALRDIVLLSDPVEMQATNAAIARSRANYNKAEEELRRMVESQANTDEEEKRLLTKVAAAKELARPANNRVIELGLADKNEEAIKVLMVEALPTTRAWLIALGELMDLETRQNEEARQQAQHAYQSSRQSMIAIAVVGVLLSLALALLVTRSIVQPISVAVSHANLVAAGDLTSHLHVEGKDEPAQLLHAMQEMQMALANVVGMVRTGAESVAIASAEIAQGNQDLSSRTENQASALEETAASMEQLSATVKQNADAAHQANQRSANASDIAMRGGVVVAQVVESMKDINISSRKISDIISVIDGIAFQTNILALNAAVEAARAGEQGRGFAVVATEVRSLAGRSAHAAKEIKTLIQASTERVEQGAALVDRAGATMNDVVSGIRHMTDLMGEVSSASNEQATGVAQIGEAVSQMDQVTQQNAALVEEMAAATERLRNQALELVRIVSTFKIDTVRA